MISINDVNKGGMEKLEEDDWWNQVYIDGAVSAMSIAIIFQ